MVGEPGGVRGCSDMVTMMNLSCVSILIRTQSREKGDSFDKDLLVRPKTCEDVEVVKRDQYGKKGRRE